MTSIKCIAVDDEPLALELISDNIKRIPFINCVGVFGSAEKAEQFLNENPVDLIFLDIQMPGLSGVDFAKKVSNTMIIFTTAYDNYAIEGFDLAAVDYVLKPIIFSRFEKACLKAKDFFELKQLNQLKEQCIIIRSEHRTVKLLLKDILYVEGLKDYVKIYTESSEKPILTRTNLKGMHDQLSARFKRVHKSYVVNFDKVSARSAEVLMLSNTEIPIGDAYKAEVKNHFNKD